MSPNIIAVICGWMREALQLPPGFCYVPDTDRLCCINREGIVLSCRQRPVWVQLAPVLTQGYYDVPVYGRGDVKAGRKKRLHVILLECFGPPRPSPSHIGCHRNDVKLDNRLENLYWGTQHDNALDRVRNERDERYLDAATVRSIYTEDGRVPDIARKYGVSRDVTARIRSGESFSVFTSDLTPGRSAPYKQNIRLAQRKNHRFTDDEVVEMRRAAKAGEGVREIARRISAPYPTVNTAVNGKAYTWVTEPPFVSARAKNKRVSVHTVL